MRSSRMLKHSSCSRFKVEGSRKPERLLVEHGCSLEPGALNLEPGCGVFPQPARGVTLVEVVVAAVIGALVAGGTLMAFVMAQQLTQISSTQVEATYRAQQTIDRFRTRVACRQVGELSDAWLDASCNATTPFTKVDELPPNGSGSVTAREYEVVPVDLDPDGPGPQTPDGQVDYFKVVTKVTWRPSE